MSRSIEQNLLSLMPTHGSQLPHRLVDTARTLLTQSRQRASTLKADEEVARMYACAHIACERLKIQLNLPPIEPRPPIPPRVYKRLYTHLDNILPARHGKPTTPNAKARDSPSGRSSALESSVKPGSKKKGFDRSTLETLSATDVTLVDTPSKSTRKGFVRSIQPGVGLHPWIRGVLAFLVSESKQEEWGRFILAGVEYVIAPGTKRTRDKWIANHLPETVAGIFVLAVSRVNSILTGRESDPASMIENALSIMHRATESLDIKGMTEEEFWIGWDTSPRASNVQEAIRRATTEWIEADWYNGLEEVAYERCQLSRSKTGPRRRQNAREQARTRKADTMHQPRYDYLGERQQREYKEWLRGTLAHIAKNGGGDLEAMEREFSLRSDSS